MTDLKCRWLAFSVFALGTCAATPFLRKSPPAMPPAPKEPVRQSAPRESGDITLQLSSAPESSRVEPVASSNAISPSSAEASRSGTLRSLPTLDNTPLPSLAAKYTSVLPESSASPVRDPEQGSAEKAAAARKATTPAPHVVNKGPVRNSVDSDDERDGDAPVARHASVAQASREIDDKRSAAIVRLPKVADSPSIVRHRVVDGDSLETLAERYLGTAQRADQIYQANRVRLAAPDLLPIGTELTITLLSNATVASDKAASPEDRAAAPVASVGALVPLTGDEIAQLRRERN
jgi:hypothetical protein